MFFNDHIKFFFGDIKLYDSFAEDHPLASKRFKSNYAEHQTNLKMHRHNISSSWIKHSIAYNIAYAPKKSLLLTERRRK